MELTDYNPQKGRQEKLSVALTAENTTRFTSCEQPSDIALITDRNGDRLIIGHGRDYPTRS